MAFFQSDRSWIGPLRDRFMPLLCRVPVSRRLMLASMAGVSRGPLRRALPIPRKAGLPDLR